MSCKAGIVDGDDELVFDLVKAEPKTLSVIYPPTEAANQTAKGTVGETAEASFVFMANPAPTEATWSITVTNEKNRRNKTEEEGEEAEGEEGNKGNSTEVEILSVKAGEMDEKYNASEIIDEGDNKYRVTLQIKNLTKEDADKDYSVEVKNDVDKTVYYFKVQVKDEDDDGEDGGGDDDDDDDDEDDDDEEEGGGAATAVFVVLAVICVIAIILGAFFVYKKKRVNNETAPLRN